MAEGKWIAGLTAAMPVRAAARLVLEARLTAVAHYLPLAALKAHEDVEHVHQLRVASRRSRAALDLFANCLPGRVVEKLSKVLRAVRRKAGAARDGDVFLERLAEADSAKTPGGDWLAGQAVALRGLAQEELRRAHRKQEPRLVRLTADAVGALTPSATDEPLAPHARRHLLGLLDTLERQGAGDLREAGQLHQLRIHGKQLRYAMEIFAECFPPAFKAELYPKVEAMQEILGHVNDLAVGIARLEAIRDQAQRFHADRWPRWQPGVQAWLRQQRRDYGRQRRAFRRFWATWQDDGVGQQFRARITASQLP